MSIVARVDLCCVVCGNLFRLFSHADIITMQPKHGLAVCC